MNLLARDLPFIKFPQDWEVKIIPSLHVPVWFAIQKEGMPNIVSVAIVESSDYKEWDVTVLLEYGDGNCRGDGFGTCIPLNNTECLLRMIEKTFTEEVITDFSYERAEEFEEED